MSAPSFGLCGAQHVAALTALHDSSFERGWSAEDFAVHLKNPVDSLFGVFEGSTLSGIILTRSAVDQAEILTLAINAARQRKGLARQLLGYAEAQLQTQGIDIVFLEVAEDNPAAIGLYRAAGYHHIGNRPGYYKRAKGRVGARLMQKRL